MGKIVRVEIADNGLPCRIFRTKDWRDLPSERVQQMDRARAVGLIREQAYQRAEGKCEECGRFVSESYAEMNEIRPKGAGGGKTGGEVSLSNCEILCPACHQWGANARHSNRRWHTAKLEQA